VSNVSITSQTPLNQVTEEVWSLFIAVNVKGMFPFLEAVISHMKKQFEDAIVNLEIVRYRFFLSLSTTKLATHTITGSLAISFAPDIRVNCYPSRSYRHALVARTEE